jgi:endonuclease YncB( thermonuclease family)
MIENGQAWVYDRYCKISAICGEFTAAQMRAKKAGLGLWADPEASPPWEHRRRKR